MSSSQIQVFEVFFDMISNNLNAFSGKVSNIPPMSQQFASFQSFAEDLLHISQSSVSRIVGKVAKVIAANHQQLIHFPTPNETPLASIGGLSGVIGTNDCTHIKICCPGGPNSDLYRDRKWYFSLNVQAVCSHDLKFTNTVARWQGSIQDSRIFRNSRLCAKF